MTAPATEQEVARAECYRCHRPARLCLCARIERVHNRTLVHVVQHPRERFHALGTLRFVELGLSRANIRVAYTHALDDVPRIEPLMLGPKAALLYPHRDARDLSELTPEERPEELVVLDGTWQHSRGLYRANPWLASLPHVRFSPTRPSRYRVRKEPRAEYVSTLEAIIYALSWIEPDTQGFEALLDAFEAMQDEHLEVRRSSEDKRERRPRLREPKAVPPELMQTPSPVVVIYGELTPRAWHLDGSRRGVLQLSAYRMRDGACFDAWCEDARPIPADYLESMEVSAADAAHTLGREALTKAFLDFCGDGAVLAAWNDTITRALPSLLGRELATCMLKPIYANVYKHTVGGLDTVSKRHELSAPRLSVRGRASERLSQAASLTRWLAERGREAIAAREVTRSAS